MSFALRFSTRRAVASALAALAVAASLPLSVTPADAGRRIYLSRDKGYNGLAEGYVVAESRAGNGTITGAVRDTPRGPQVRLPGGTWEYCRRSCSETLRVETIDFWEARDGRAPECGIAGCIGVHIGR